MVQEGFNQAPASSCPEMEERLLLLAADELEHADRAAVETHVASCAHCARRLEAERHLLSSVLAAEHAEPDAALLARCRAVLDDALDALEESSERGWLERGLDSLWPVRWLAVHPAASAVFLIVFGFSVGVLAPRFFRPSAGRPFGGTQTPETPSAGTESPGIPDWRAASLAGINWTPAGDNDLPQVELQLKTERPMVVQGTVNDESVRRLLLGVLNGGERFDPDTRLTSVELLEARSKDADVRQALCQAVHSDTNPAVRLKALEALNGAEPQDLVRDTLIDALVDDQNPGVRVEAINTLRAMVEHGQMTSDPRLVKVLSERMKKDSNDYIRLQSAAALEDIGPREKF